MPFASQTCVFVVHTGGAWTSREVEVRFEKEELRACDKWAEARRTASNVEFWGTGDHSVFSFTEDVGDSVDPPPYQSARHSHVQLRMSEDGHWYLGKMNADGIWREGGLRSTLPVEPGLHPEHVESWSERSTAAAGHRTPSSAFSLRNQWLMLGVIFGRRPEESLS
jgi:hypothetical protein